MPIIMLTAKTRESDLLLGLNIGADDFMTKPFSVDELLARANAFLRRRRKDDEELQQFGDCTLDRRAKVVSKRGQPLDLTPKEFRLLDYLSREAGRAIPREELLRAVWGSVRVTSRAVDRCVTTLRAKIEDDPKQPRWLVTVRDVGYRFQP
jgi:DNA-binding response OmpR family regulator